jgi:hypothetical protein
MQIKLVYPYYTEWLSITCNNEFYIINKNNNKLVKTFDEDITKIANIKYNSCCIYTKTGYYYVNLVSNTCVKHEDTYRKFQHLGTLNDTIEVFKQKCSKSIFVYDKSKGKHQILNHSKSDWVIDKLNDDIMLFEADKYGIYIKHTLYKYPNETELDVKKIQSHSNIIIIHGKTKKEDLLLKFSKNKLKFIATYSLFDIIDFYIVTNNIILFFDGYFKIIKDNECIDFYTYDNILAINEDSILYIEESILNILNLDTLDIRMFVIDYKIKHVCENQNKNILIVNEFDDIIFV